MKYMLSVAAVSIMLISCSPTSQVNNFETIKKEHKLIAILPADARFTLNESERTKIGESTIRQSEQDLSFMIQSEESKYFQKHRKQYTVAIQDIKTTNELLFASGRNFDQFRNMQQDSIAKLLKVDAVVFCNTSLAKKMTDGEYSAKEAIGMFMPPGFTGSQYKVVMQIGLVDKYYPTVIWNTTYKPSGKREEDIFGIMKRTLSRAAETFPYRK